MQKYREIVLLSITEHACAFQVPIYISLEMNTVLE